MAMIKGVGDFFGLDIGTTAVRAIQLAQTGPDKWVLKHYGYAPLDIKTALGDSTEARHRLGEIILTVIGQSGIKTKNVAIGLPSSKTFITVIDVPMLSEAELRGTIKYQIDEYIPMAIDEAKVDWTVLGQSLHDPSKQEILLASTAEAYSEERLEFVEALGLNVIAAEPDPIAMIRSVLPAGAKDAQMIVDVGESSTNVAITFGDAPRLVRTIPTGIASLVKAAVQNLNIQEDQARQFILKFGLAPDRLEGQVLGAIDSVLDSFVAELTKSIQFFKTRYPNTPVTTILLVGYASAVPKFGEYISGKTNIATQIGNPWQKVNVPSNDQKLAAISPEFATVVGLAQRSNQS